VSDSTVIPLHVRSGYSLLCGASRLDRLVGRLAGMGCARAALTDVNSLCGATQFWRQACEAGVQPLIGAELQSEGSSVVALVESEAGYENLCRLITRIQGGLSNVDPASRSSAPLRRTSCRSGFAKATPDTLSMGGRRSRGEASPAGAEDRSPGREPGDPDAPQTQSPGGAIESVPGGVLSQQEERPGSGGLRPRLRSAVSSGLRDVERFVACLIELSGGIHFIVEDVSLADRLLSEGGNCERIWVGIDPATQTYGKIRRLQECAERTGVQLIAMGKALYATPDERDVARLLAAIRKGTTYDNVTAADLPHPKACLREPAQLREELTDFPDAIRNNHLLAERCGDFRLLPREPVFPGFACPDGLTAEAYLRRLCRAGIPRRYATNPPPGLDARLDKELRLIERMGFSEYFLVVWDIVGYARRRGVPVAGRGSGASSVVAYLLGVTNVCPLRYRIPFERFLNERRCDFPDLDIDFCWRIRDDVIDYAFERWGGGRVAMVCTHNTFQPASAIRETAKAFGLSDEQISRFAKAERRSGAGVDMPGLSPQRLGQISRLSQRIIGLPHLLSVHPGGIVIGRKPIDRYVPIQRAAKGVMITQYDKHGVEDIGLVKLDLLGNRSLSTIRSSCDLLARRGVRVDVEALPTDDAATLRLLRAADTVGCNQLESPAMRHLLRAMAPNGPRDVMKALALIRPGAASIGMKEVFIRRQRGLDPVPAADPRVDPVLGETHGVMLYEDDVMLVAAAMLGTSLAGADPFRKAVQKCRTDAERLRLSKRFLTRCAANGVDMDYAKSMWVQMAKFNAYSFCRAHAASYATLAWAVAYLKAHHPAEFWVAAMNNNQSMYPTRVYVEQAKLGGIRFRRPDVNRSEEEFTLEGGAIRVGLNRVDGLGPAGVEAIVDSRNGRAYAGVSDLLARTGLGREETRSLILCGAFDFTDRPRPALMMEMNLFVTIRPHRPAGDHGLFTAAPTIPAPPGDYDEARKYLDEWRILGFSVREHVLSRFRDALSGRVDMDSRRIARSVGRRVRIAGLVEARRTTKTGRGEAMMFATLADEFGLFEVTVFPDALRSLRGGMNGYGPYIVTGTLDEQYGTVGLTAERVERVTDSIGLTWSRTNRDLAAVGR